MPQIDTPLLLDILLGLVILLFIPFGIRRGVAKEAMVSAGILLGATLADRFAETWGSELVARFSLEPGTATFLASLLLLFGSTFLLGYGGGAALGVVRPGTLSRLVGGLLAAFNAALLLSYLLAWIEADFQQTAPLDDGILSEALLRRADLLLLAAAGVLLALTILGWVVNAARSRRQPRGANGGAPAAIPVRQRPVRVARDADAGKYEPGAEPVAASGRFGAGLDATSPLPAASAYGDRPAWPRDEQAAWPANGHGGSTRSFSASGAPGQNDETIWTSWSTPGSEKPRSTSETTTRWPVAPSLGVTDDERCAVCHARVGSRDVFCPECGATL